MRPSLAALFAFALVAAGCPDLHPGGSDAGESPADAGSTDGGSTDGGTGGDACTFGGSGARATGWACNSDADCASGICYQGEDDFGDPLPGYCSAGCDPATPTCPDGFSCEAVGGGDPPNLCVAGSSTTLLPGDGSGKFGDPCTQDADCASGTKCEQVTDGDRLGSFCAPSCDPNAAVDTCGECGSCAQIGYDENYDPAYACAPKGPKAIGDACTSDFECQTFDCRGFCTKACGGDNGLECPAGISCVDAGFDGSLCAPPSDVGTKQSGDTCSYPFECATGLACSDPDFTGTNSCRPLGSQGDACEADGDCSAGLSCKFDDDTFDSTCEPPAGLGEDCFSDTDCLGGLDCRTLSGSASVCSHDCSPDCGADGTCVAVDLDSNLAVYASADDSADPLAHNDDASYPSNLWSEIDGLSLAPGQYWVRVAGYSSSGGTYALSILVDGQTPGAETELPETPVRNDDPANAQPLLSFPTVVAGRLDDGSDVDWYVFTVPGSAAVTVTLKTGPGAPSACLPSSKVGQTPLGGACSVDAYCASGECERTNGLDVCGKSCTSDGDCGDGNVCADLGSRQTCLPAADVGQKQTGDDCTLDYECQSGLCATFGFSTFCAPPCGDPATTCPISTECADVQASRGGQTVMVKGCVPEGDHSAAFNADCQLESDCETGLDCVDHRCGNSCRTDADCPYQDFPPKPDAPATDCQPCTADADCGGGGAVCANGRGYEQVCIEPCDSAGKCPLDGFACTDISGGGDMYCVPADFSCRRPVCVVPDGASSGSCTVPVSDFGELCGAAADCTTGDCSGGYCSRACSEDADCGCDVGDLVCDQATGECLPDPAGLAEVEPNETDDDAQKLGDLPAKVFGVLAVEDGQPDVDRYTVDLAAGDTLKATTRPVCGTGALGLKTAVRITFAGSTVAAGDQSANYDSASLTAADGGTYVVEVSDPTFTGEQTGAYVLEVTK